MRFTTDNVLDLVKYGAKKKKPGESYSLWHAYSVPGTVSRKFTVYSSQQPYETNTDFMPILRMEKLRFQDDSYALVSKAHGLSMLPCAHITWNASTFKCSAWCLTA